jgi:hypothetical protein
MPWKGWPHGRQSAGGVRGSLALVLSFGLPAGATNAFPTTDDHSTEIATAWWWYYGETGAQVGTLLNHHHARLTQIRVINPSGPSGPTFAGDDGRQ